METATKLEKLLIEEISAVDSPANLLDGFVQFPDGRTWKSRDDESTDKAVWTTAYMNDLPDSAFLYVESGGEKDEDGKTKPRSLRHFPYKDADGKVDLPHLRNALARIPQSNLPQDVKDKVSAKAEKLLEGMKKSEAPASAQPTTTLGTIRNLLFPARKDDIEMTSEELTAALDERDTALVEKFAEVVKSAVVPVEGAPAVETPAASVETPAVEAPVAEATPSVDEATGLSVEDVTKAIQDAFEPYNEILEKTLDRVERIEAAFGIAARQSLEGQENGKATKTEKTTTPEDKAEGIGIVKSLLSRPLGAGIGSVERG